MAREAAPLDLLAQWCICRAVHAVSRRPTHADPGLGRTASHARLHRDDHDDDATYHRGATHDDNLVLDDNFDVGSHHHYFVVDDLDVVTFLPDSDDDYRPGVGGTGRALGPRRGRTLASPQRP